MPSAVERRAPPSRTRGDSAGALSIHRSPSSLSPNGDDRTVAFGGSALRSFAAPAASKRSNRGLAVEGEDPLAPRSGREESSLGKGCTHELDRKRESVLGQTAGQSDGRHPGRAPRRTEVGVTGGLQTLGRGRADRRREQGVVAHGESHRLVTKALSGLLGQEEGHGRDDLPSREGLTNLGRKVLRMSRKQRVVRRSRLRLHYGERGVV